MSRRTPSEKTPEAPNNPVCRTCDVESEHIESVGVFVCPFCGHQSASYLEVDEYDVPVLGVEPNTDPIVFLGYCPTENGLQVLVDSPYHAREDLLELPKDTGRQWNPTRSTWVIHAGEKDRAKELIEELGYGVIDLIELRQQRGIDE